MDAREMAGWTELLADRSDDVATLARQLRSTALEALPDLTERFYPGWQALGLRHPHAGLLASIFPREDDVVVYLERGASLPDPHGLLHDHGRLKQTRTLTFQPGADSPTPEQLVAYLDLAIEHRGR